MQDIPAALAFQGLLRYVLQKVDEHLHKAVFAWMLENELPLFESGRGSGAPLRVFAECVRWFGSGLVVLEVLAVFWDFSVPWEFFG